jgi:hypothetical protein
MNKAYVVTGAYNPPTLAHEEITKSGAKHAISTGHTHFFQGFGGSSETEDAPLTKEQKEGYIKDIHKHLQKDNSVKGINWQIIPAENNTPFHHITHIVEQHGINHITIGLGSDQLGKGGLRSNIEKHIQTHGGLLGSDKKTVHPVTIAFHQLGKPRIEQDLGRDEELKRVRAGDLSVVKAGKIRKAHAAGDTEYVREMLPRGINHNKIMKDLTSQNKKIAAARQARKTAIIDRRNEKKSATAARNAAKKVSKKKLKEDFLAEATASIATRMKESRAAKRTSKRRALTRRIRSRSRRNIKVLKRRAYSQIKTILRKRLFGGSTKKLSVAQRYMIDKMINKRKPLLNRMVKAIIPKVMTGESKRMQRANSSRRLRENVSPLNFIIQNLNEAEKKPKRPASAYKTKQEVRRDQNSRKRKQRSNDQAATSSNPFSGQVLVVRDSSNDDLMIIKKESFDSNRHTVIISPEKMNMGSAQNTMGNEDFVNTPTSIELFGRVDDAPTRSEKKAKGQAQPQQAQAPVAPVEVPPPVTKTGKKSTFPDSDHSATDMEAGIVGAFNEIKGLDPDKQAQSDLLGPKEHGIYTGSQTLSSAGQRAAIQLHQHLKKLFPDSDFIAMHYGRKKDQKISKFWSGQGGTDNTPKSDIIFQDRRTGMQIGVSVKCGPSQFMSGKAAGEATATVMTALQNMDPKKLTPVLKKKVNNLLERLKDLVVSDRTSQGGIEQYKMGGEKEGEDKKVLKYDKLHHESKIMLRELFSESKEFKKALLLEAATGRVKFDTGKKGQTSPSVAQYLLSVNKDGTGLSLNEINEDFIDKIADSVSQIEVRFKSSRIYNVKVGKKDTDPYSYWSVMALGVGSKGLSIHETFFKFSKVLNELMSPDRPEDTSTTFEIHQLIEQLKDYIDGDPMKLMEFLEIIPTEVGMADVDLTDFAKQESGLYNTVIINGKEIDIPVEQDIDYNDTSEFDKMQTDAEETNTMMQQQQQGAAKEEQKENYINIALTFLAERTKYNKATGRDYDAEYKWQGTGRQKKRRAQRNRDRRAKIRKHGKSALKGKDIHHEDGNPHNHSSSNVKVVSTSYNRSIKENLTYSKIMEKVAAWQRKEGKDPEGGLNQKGVDSYRRENPGSNLQTAVTTKPSKLKKNSKKAKRRKSFCSRMKGMKSKLTSAKTARDPDSRINKSLRKWNCENYEPEIKALIESLKKACWSGYEAIGMKKKGGKKVPNCVPVNEDQIHSGESPQEYRARLLRRIQSGDIKGMDIHDRVHGALAYVNHLQPQYPGRALNVVVRHFLKKGGEANAQGLIVTGIDSKGKNLTGHPTGAGGTSTRHRQEVNAPLKNITGLHRSRYADMDPKHVAILDQLMNSRDLREMYEQALDEEIVNKDHKGKMTKSMVKGAKDCADSKPKGIKPIKGNDTQANAEARYCHWLQWQKKGGKKKGKVKNK